MLFGLLFDMAYRVGRRCEEQLPCGSRRCNWAEASINPRRVNFKVDFYQRQVFIPTESWVTRKETFPEHAEQERDLDRWFQYCKHGQVNVKGMFIVHCISPFLQPSGFKVRWLKMSRKCQVIEGIGSPGTRRAEARQVQRGSLTYQTKQLGIKMGHQMCGGSCTNYWKLLNACRT